MNFFIGTDIGTSGTKTVLFDENGVVIAESFREYPLQQPQAAWAEQNPDDWWRASFETIKEVVAVSKVDPSDIKGVGLSGQMHGLVMLDSDGKVLRPSIIWCDQRTVKECAQITDLIGYDKLLDITCNPALTGFTASKIMWVKNNEPEIFNKCDKILLPKDYVRFKLTGEYATEVSDASGMQLLDVKNRCWSNEVLDKLGINKNKLGKVYESCEVTGYINDEAAKLTGLNKGTLVAGGAGDQAAAAVGGGIVKEGLVSCTIGSSGVVFAHTDKPVFDKAGRLHTFCHAVPSSWHVMGVTQGAGLSMKWFKDNFYTLESQSHKNIYDIINSDIADCPPLSEGLMYLPYLMGERCPHLDADARGVFFGISAIHTKKHFARAVMEGVSYSLVDCLELIKEAGIVASEINLGGGGAKSPLWRSMLSDMFGIRTFTPVSREAGCLGVAVLAAVASGVYKDVQSACGKMVSKKGAFDSPDMPLHEKYVAGHKLYKNIYQSLKNNFKEIKG